MDLKSDTLLRYITMAATFSVVVTNFLANALPINGQTTGAISDRIDVYFTPAGYTFSIWGLIYAGLFVYTIFQLLPSRRERYTLEAIAPLYWLGSLANIAWILLWHYEYFELTWAAMLILLFTLIAIYLLLEIGRADVPASMRWAVHGPFSLYLGWITVATIANVTSLLWLKTWSGFGIGDEIWTVIVLVIAVIIAAAVSLSRRDVVFCLVLVWAFIGIAVKHSKIYPVTTSALVASALCLLLSLYAFYRKRRIVKIARYT